MKRKTTYAFIGALICSLLITGVTYQSVNAYVQVSNSLATNADTSADLQNLGESYQAASLELNSYMITGTPAYEQQAYAQLPQINGTIQELGRLTAGNSTLNDDVNGFASFVQNGLVHLLGEAESVRSLSLNGTNADALTSFVAVVESDSQNMSARIQSLSTILGAAADTETNKVTSLAGNTLLSVGSGGAVVIAITGLSFMYLNRNVTRLAESEESLKNGEERLKQFLEGIPLAVLVVDSTGRPVFSNRASSSMLGTMTRPAADREKPAEPYGLYIAGTDTPYPADRLPTVRALAGEAARFDDIEIRRPDGVLPVEVWATPIYDGAGKISYGLVAFADVSERKKLERLKSTFVSTVSHELRTPLTSIRASLGLLSAGGVAGTLPEKGQRMLQIAVSNTDRLIRLINDILDLEKLESGKLVLEKKNCTANELMRQAYESMNSLAQKAGVKLILIPADLTAVIHVDPDRIIQVMTNLVGNAIKFSTDGGRVWLGADVKGDDAVFYVRDEGRGIPSDKIAGLFQRFHQVDSSDSREKGGTGLGLAISRTIVLQHGGDIWVENAAGGKGSVFQFSIPLVETEEGPRGDPGAGGRLVLFCDDDRSIRAVMVSLLEREGYSVISASSGAEAIDQAVLHHPGAILLDMLMPGMSGLETLAELKNRTSTKEIPVVVLSILERNNDLNSQISDWVSKPFDETKLFQSIRKAIDGSVRTTPLILIVEDDADLSQVLAEIFKRNGAETVLARSGEHAIQLLQEGNQPDLLILDVMLPKLDGFGLVEWLRKRGELRSTPLIVYTAKDLDESERDRLSMGGTTQFFIKSKVAPEEFERRVIAIMREVVQQRKEDHAGLVSTH
ncbi:MAG: response regulator [Thaumarchaeota archaeon]|nr:response regulator [Nitrososphaerota archaeon]